FTQNPPPLVKCAQDAAQVSGIQFKFFAQFRSCGLLAVGEFVEHADFTQGQRTVEQPFLQNTNLPRVEAIEAPDGLNALTEFVGSGSAACHEISVVPMIDFVNYIVAIESTRFGTNKNARDHPPGVFELNTVCARLSDVLIQCLLNRLLRHIANYLLFYLATLKYQQRRDTA